jgi:hypothetical protein
MTDRRTFKDVKNDRKHDFPSTFNSACIISRVQKGKSYYLGSNFEMREGEKVK